MPFIGHAILLNTEIADLTKIRQEFNVFSNTPPWNLIYLYFGSFFVGAGSTLFAASCPATFKRYADFADYRNKERDLWRNPEFRKQKSQEIKAEVLKNIHDVGYPGQISSRNHRYFTDIETIGSDPDRIDEYLFQ